MGRLPRGRRKYSIQEMQSVHREVVRRILIGQKSVDVAKDLGVTPAMVSYTRNSPIVQRQLAIMEAVRDIDAVDVSKRIKDLAPKAVTMLEEVMDNENSPAAVKVKAAVELLKMNGFVPPVRIQGSVLHGHLTMRDIDDMKRRAIESGVVVNTKPELVEVSG